LTDLKGLNPTKPPAGHKIGSEGKVHRGFREAWEEVQEMVLKTTEDLLKTGAYQDMYVCGHSLGGALSTMASISITHNVLQNKGIDVPLKSYTYGSPRVGDEVFQKDYNRLVPETYRVQNDEDIVPHCPLKLNGYRHVGLNVFVNNNGVFMLNPGQKLAAEMASDDPVFASSWRSFLPVSGYLSSKIDKEKAEDHMTNNYISILARFDYLAQMPQHLRPRCPFPCQCSVHNTWLRRAWKALLSKPMRYKVNSKTRLLQPVEDTLRDANETAMVKVLNEQGPILEQRRLTSEDIMLESQYQAGGQGKTIEYHHFEAAAAKLLFCSQQVLVHRNKTMELDLLFSTYDVNDDGYLSWKEFCQLCYEVFPKMKPEEIRSAFVQLDANHVFDDKVPPNVHSGRESAHTFLSPFQEVSLRVIHITWWSHRLWVSRSHRTRCVSPLFWLSLPSISFQQLLAASI
jgi:hypothetical protein